MKYTESKLADVCQTRKGLATSDNNRFLRLWFEVERDRISFSCYSNEQTEKNGIRLIKVVVLEGGMVIVIILLIGKMTVMK